jgi:site-specific DNA-methyltransferase (adenine-specific)
VKTLPADEESQGSIEKLHKVTPTSTVGRGRTVKEIFNLEVFRWADRFVDARLGDSLGFYQSWESPTVIISGGGYGVLGFEGDTSDHFGLPEWYEPHIAAWSRAASPITTLWFWNSEIGWASVHPILEKYGWRYVMPMYGIRGKAI